MDDDEAEFRRRQTKAGLPHKKILLHWDNRHYEELSDPLPDNVYLTGVLIGGEVEVYRTRIEPVPKLPMPQRLWYFLGFAGLVFGGMLLMPLVMAVVSLAWTVAVPIALLVAVARRLLRNCRR